MAVGDAYKLDLFQLFLGQRVMNSMVFARKAETPPTQAECLALAMDWKDFLRLYQNLQLSHTNWKVTQLSGAGVTYSSSTCTRSGGLAFEGIYTGIVIGSVAGEALPPQCARVTTLLTGQVGRSKRGRFYMAAISEGVTQNGDFGSGEMATHQTAWDGQYAKFSGPGTNLVWQAGVWSQTIATGCKPGSSHPHALTSVATPNPTAAFTAINAYKTRPVVYTQRRRTIGVGA